MREGALIVKFNGPERLNVRERRGRGSLEAGCTYLLVWLGCVVGAGLARAGLPVVSKVLLETTLGRSKAVVRVLLVRLTCCLHWLASPVQLNAH